MGLFKAFTRTLSAATRVAATPLTVIADMGSAAAGSDGGHTIRNLDKVEDDIDDAIDELEDVF